MANKQRGKKTRNKGAVGNGGKGNKHAQKTEDSRKPQPQTMPTSSDWRMAFGLFLVAFVVYISNGTFVTSNDQTANIYFPLQLFRGKMSWAILDNPALFKWKMTQKNMTKEIMFPTSMDGPVLGTNMTTRELLNSRKGIGLGVKHKYMLTQTVGSTRDYVNTFNFGTGVTFTPVVAVLALFYKFDLEALQANTWLLLQAGKAFASALVAASASFVFLSAITFPSVTRSQALIIGIVYSFGTLSWSVSSQALWQHAANEFYLAVTIWALLLAHLHHKASKKTAIPLVALCGFSVAMATISRPTSAVVAASIGVYFLLKGPIKLAAVYAMVGGAIGILQLYYNFHYFGNPFEFGQTKEGMTIAAQKTGSTDLWQTPILTGASTLLFSPSRGLFIFSPFTIFAMPAFFFVWLPTFSGRELKKKHFSSSALPSRNEFEALRPLCISVAVLWVIAFKFFDYWGGWCFGYRPLADTLPMVMMMLCVMFNRIQRHSGLWYLFLALVAYSFYVQFVGAFAASIYSWNNRSAEVFYPPGKPAEWAFDSESIARLAQKYPSAPHETHDLDIDKPEFRARLWHWSDNQIMYCIQNFDGAREFIFTVMKDFAQYH